MNIFDIIKDKCIHKSGIGRQSLQAFLEVLREVEEEYTVPCITCNHTTSDHESAIVTNADKIM